MKSRNISEKDELLISGLIEKLENGELPEQHDVSAALLNEARSLHDLQLNVSQLDLSMPDKEVRQQVKSMAKKAEERSGQNRTTFRWAMRAAAILVLASLTMYYLLPMSNSHSIPEFDSASAKIAYIHELSGEVLSSEQLNSLTNFLEDKSPNVRVYALDILSEYIEDPRVNSSINELIAWEETPSVQMASLNLVRDLKSPETVHAIEVLLGKTDIEPDIALVATAILNRR